VRVLALGKPSDRKRASTTRSRVTIQLDLISISALDTPNLEGISLDNLLEMSETGVEHPTPVRI